MQPFAFLTLAAGILGLAFLASFVGIGPFHPRRTRFGLIELSLAVLVTLIAMADFSVFPAFGMFVMLAAGPVWVVAALLSLRGERALVA